MIPTLPGQDPVPASRAGELERQRASYAFLYDANGILGAKELPLHERTDAKYWAELARVSAELEVNKVATARRPAATGLAAYERLYTTIEAPPIVQTWQRDDVFAWQAVAGTNPVMLRRLDRLLEHFPVTEAQFARAVAGDTLAAALAEGRLFVSDYAMLDGLPDGVIDGHHKYGTAPIALYVAGAEGLRAVAIQGGQQPSSGIFTPADGVSWRMARTTVSAADGNVQGIVTHFAMCHQILEAVILSTHRRLSARHPLYALLVPHFRDTLQTNDIARKSLFSVGGNMDRLQSPTLEASLGLARRSITDFRLLTSAPHEDAARRGLDGGTLADFPARDDALLMWGPVHAWVDSYLRLYYTSAADVAADDELAAWVTELGAEDGGRLGGLSRPQTVEDVVALVSRIVFRCTVFHASINYSSFPLFSFAPNVQTAAFAPGPRGGGLDTEAAFEAMLPPVEYAWQAFQLFFDITVRLDNLGDYPAFADPRVAPVLATFRAALSDCESVIAERNTRRLMAYPWMAPSSVPMSIQV